MTNLISIVMPARNAESTIGVAIESIFKSTNLAIEVIVVEDASTDSTAGVLRQIREPRIKVIQNSRKAGVAGSLNIGLAEAQGNLIARLDADDLMKSGRLEAQTEFLNRHQDYGLVGSWAREFGSRQRLLIAPTQDALLNLSLLIGNPFVHSSVMLRRTVLEQVGGTYSETHEGAEDYELWTRFARQTKLSVIPKPLTLHRRHNRQVSVINRTGQRTIAQKVRKNYANSLGVILPTSQNPSEILSWFISTRRLMVTDQTIGVQDLLLLLRALRDFGPVRR